jgi:hypothetical protein
MQAGNLVESKKGSLGVGVVVAVRDDMAFVYFKDHGDSGARKFRFDGLRLADDQSNPALKALKFSGDVATGFKVMRTVKAKKATASEAS